MRKLLITVAAAAATSMLFATASAAHADPFAPTCPSYFSQSTCDQARSFWERRQQQGVPCTGDTQVVPDKDGNMTVIHNPPGCNPNIPVS
jgi:hypothetical protein